MIKLPDFQKAFDYENNFYLTCQSGRIGKLLAHYELYKMASRVPGAIVECGVFKGSSLVRFAAFHQIFNAKKSKKIIGFDTFGEFPESSFVEDQVPWQKFVKNAGSRSISRRQLLKILNKKHVNNVELVAGEITKTVPNYLLVHPDLKISLLNLDTDIYEPAVAILECFFPRLAQGGILILDDYGVFPGETKAVDDYFKGRRVKIHRFPFVKTPHYIIKK